MRSIKNYTFYTEEQQHAFVRILELLSPNGTVTPEQMDIALETLELSVQRFEEDLERKKKNKSWVKKGLESIVLSSEPFEEEEMFIYYAEIFSDVGFATANDKMDELYDMILEIYKRKGIVLPENSERDFSFDWDEVDEDEMLDTFITDLSKKGYALVEFRSFDDCQYLGIIRTETVGEFVQCANLLKILDFSRQWGHINHKTLNL